MFVICKWNDNLIFLLSPSVLLFLRYFPFMFRSSFFTASFLFISFYQIFIYGRKFILISSLSFKLLTFFSYRQSLRSPFPVILFLSLSLSLSLSIYLVSFHLLFTFISSIHITFLYIFLSLFTLHLSLANYFLNYYVLTYLFYYFFPFLYIILCYYFS